MGLQSSLYLSPAKYTSNICSEDTLGAKCVDFRLQIRKNTAAQTGDSPPVLASQAS